jgi:hypothetical protein
MLALNASHSVQIHLNCERFTVTLCKKDVLLGKSLAIANG